MTKQTHQEDAPTPDRLTCQQVTDVLVDYVAEDMAPAMRTVFAKHLRNCQDCRAFLNTYRETIRATRTVRCEDIPGEMLNRVQQFLRAKIQDSRPS
jgi:23S rRNA U2552 (ribose-2'-O)-methylase RlmE/FtsJ